MQFKAKEKAERALRSIFNVLSGKNGPEQKAFGWAAVATVALTPLFGALAAAPLFFVAVMAASDRIENRFDGPGHEIFFKKTRTNDKKRNLKI